MNVEHDLVKIDPVNFKMVEISEFIPPPLGKMTYLDFNILYHVHLIEQQEDV